MAQPPANRRSPSASQEWLDGAPVETGEAPVAATPPCAPAAAGSTGDVAMEPATAGTIVIAGGGTTATAGDRVPERPECPGGDAMRLAWIHVGTEKSRGLILRGTVSTPTRPRAQFSHRAFPHRTRAHAHRPARSERTKKRIAERERQAERKAGAEVKAPAPAKAGAEPKAKPTPAKAGKGGGQTARYRSTTRRSSRASSAASAAQSLPGSAERGRTTTPRDTGGASSSTPAKAGKSGPPAKAGKAVGPKGTAKAGTAASSWTPAPAGVFGEAWSRNPVVPPAMAGALLQLSPILQEMCLHHARLMQDCYQRFGAPAVTLVSFGTNPDSAPHVSRGDFDAVFDVPAYVGTRDRAEDRRAHKCSGHNGANQLAIVQATGYGRLLRAIKAVIMPRFLEQMRTGAQQALEIGISCVRGRHRSVATVVLLAHVLRTRGCCVELTHASCPGLLHT